MEDEYRTDIETVLKWTGDVDDYEEDIINMLTFQLKVRSSSTCLHFNSRYRHQHANISAQGKMLYYRGSQNF